MTKRCWVYWIHLPEHTDLFSEGYVGITTIGVQGWVPSEDSEYMAWKQANEKEAIDA